MAVRNSAVMDRAPWAFLCSIEITLLALHCYLRTTVPVAADIGTNVVNYYVNHPFVGVFSSPFSLLVNLPATTEYTQITLAWQLFVPLVVNAAACRDKKFCTKSLAGSFCRLSKLV